MTHVKTIVKKQITHTKNACNFNRKCNKYEPQKRSQNQPDCCRWTWRRKPSLGSTLPDLLCYWRNSHQSHSPSQTSRSPGLLPLWTGSEAFPEGAKRSYHILSSGTFSSRTEVRNTRPNAQQKQMRSSQVTSRLQPFCSVVVMRLGTGSVHNSLG